MISRLNGWAVLVTGVAAVMLYLWGHSDGRAGREPGLSGVALAAQTAMPKAWSPTKPYPSQNVYYPGTEALAPDEMRVIACGTGMPTCE